MIGPNERSVTELVEASSLSQPVVSQHLKVLRDAHLVAVRVDGNRRLYCADFTRLGELRQLLDSFWTTKLDALKRAAETDQTEREPS